jgi:glycosyltransferase involved in cell wall biosynthesis
MTAAPRVAVLVPCLDCGETLPETIAELPADVEIAVIDDGSTDPATLEVLRDLERDGRVRVVRDEHAGVAAALSRGLAETTAPYVVPLGSDDLLDGAAIDALADALDQRPDVSFAYGEVRTFGESDLRKLPAPTPCPWLITLYNHITPPMLYRRTALVAVGGWRPGAGWEDWDMHASLLEGGHRGSHLPGAVHRYRVRPGVGEFQSTVASFDERYGELRAAYPELFRRRWANWRRSPVPLPLRLLLAAIDVAPGLGRLRKTQLAELLVVLLWRNDVRAARAMVRVVAGRGFRATA